MTGSRKGRVEMLQINRTATPGVLWPKEPPPDVRGGARAESARSTGGLAPDLDRLDLSQEASDRKVVEEALRKRQEELDARDAAFENALSGAQSAVPVRSMGKCMKIAARIMKGDSVPEADEKFLSAYAPELYRQAVLMRHVAQEPERHESLLDEQELADTDAAMVMSVLRPELRRLAEDISSGALDPAPAPPTEPDPAGYCINPGPMVY